MKLEVGMYCYNKTNRKQGIGKIISFQKNNNVNIRYENDIELVSIGNVVASDNVIDLIKDGDIVNIEYYVSKYKRRIIRLFECSLFECKDESDILVVFENKHGNWYYGKNKKEWIESKGYNPKIKSIITKEQFEQKSYRINEENN